MHALFHEHIEEVERSADELHWALKSNASALKSKHMHEQARGLAGWVECYRLGLHHGLLTDGMQQEYGNAWLTGVSDRLKLETGTFSGSGYGASPLEKEYPAQQPETKHFVESARHIRRAASSAAHDNSTHDVKREAIMKTRIKDLMVKDPATISPDSTLKEAAQEMEANNCGCCRLAIWKSLRG